MAAPMAIVVVYRHASLDILSPQVKSAPPQGSCLWLRPQAALWIGETNDSEPLTTHRKESGDIETGDANLSQDHYGGCLLIGHGVSGVQVA